MHEVSMITDILCLLAAPDVTSWVQATHHNCPKGFPLATDAAGEDGSHCQTIPSELSGSV